MVELEGRGPSTGRVLLFTICRLRVSSLAWVWRATLSGQSFYVGWVGITSCPLGCGSSSLGIGLGFTHFLVRQPWKKTTELGVCRVK